MMLGGAEILTTVNFDVSRALPVPLEVE